MTLHYIGDFKHHSITIGMVQLHEGHTAHYLKNKMLELLNFWGIPLEKIVAAVSDNAANALKAHELLLGNDMNIGCFAHSIHLVIKNSIQEVCEFDAVLGKVKNIVSFFPSQQFSCNRA